MRALNLGAVLIALIAATPTAAPAAGVAEAAPRLVLSTLAGDAFDLAGHVGEVVYVDFWASWCAPCRKSFPWMNALQARYLDRGLVVVAVNLDESLQDAESFLGKFPARFTVLRDASGESARSWKVKGMPTSYIVGRDGKLVATHIGFRDHDIDALERQIQDALSAPR